MHSSHRNDNGMDVGPIRCIEAGEPKSNVALLRKDAIMSGFDPMRMSTINHSRTGLTLDMVTALGLVLALCAPASAGGPPDASLDTTLDHGFLGLYSLDFAGAQKDFSAWEAQH